MPLGLLPGAVVEVYATADMSLPAAERPAFLCKYMTCRQAIEWDEALTALANDRTGGLAADNAKLNDLLKRWLVGVRRMGDMTLDRALDEALSVGDKWALAWSLPSQQRTTEQDRKNFESPSCTDGAASAPVAAPSVTVSATAT